MRNRAAWIDEYLHELRRERERVEKTARHQLGAAVLACGRRPWRVLALPWTMVRLVLRGPVLPASFPHPPPPSPWHGEDEEVSPEARREVEELVREINAIEQGLAFHLGTELLALRHAPWRVVRLPGRLRRFAPPERHPPCESGTTERIPILEHGAPLPEHGAPLLAAPVRRTGWSSIAPPWLEEMLAHEGVRPDRQGVAGAPDALLVGVTDSAPGPLEGRLAAARRAGTRTACWLLGEELRPDLVAPLRLADAVFAADPDVARRARELLGRAVPALPPAVQPRLQNPIGRWAGSPANTVPWTPSPPPEGDWERLQRLARGERLGESELARVEQVLDAPMPRPPAPSWAGGSADLWRRMAQTRRVLSEETLARRLRRVGEALDLPGRDPAPRVSVLLCTYRPRFLEASLSHFNAQTYAPRELVLVLNGDAFDPRRVERLVAQSPTPARVFRTPARWTKSTCLGLACERARGDLLVLMDDDDWYGPRYVEDFVHAFLFSEAGVVCKSCHVTRFEADGRMFLSSPGKEYRYGVFAGNGAAMALRREVLQEVGWREAPSGEDTLFFRDCLAHGIPILSTARFQYVRQRRNPKDHTWKLPRADLIRGHHAQQLPASARPQDFQA